MYYIVYSLSSYGKLSPYSCLSCLPDIQIFRPAITHLEIYFDVNVLCGLLFPQIQHTDDMENEMDELLQEFEEKSGRPFLHTVCFY